MAQGIPRPGERYLHFKNRLYQIVTVAKHSETGENLVVYQALYGEYGIYARPLTMFISEVDHEKYPEAAQKFRFMLVEETEKPSMSSNVRQAGTQQAGFQRTSIGTPGTQTRVAAAKTKENSEVPSLLMDFFDAKTCEEKYKILIEMREIITDTMVNNMAVVLDLVIPEGELDDRYEELKRCLRTQQKFETSRLH